MISRPRGKCGCHICGTHSRPQPIHVDCKSRRVRNRILARSSSLCSKDLCLKPPTILRRRHSQQHKMILQEVRMESTISTEDLKAKLDRKDPVKVVETLAPERYREAHLPGALNIPPNRSKNSLRNCCPTRMLRSSPTARACIETPAHMPPVNWRQWVTPTWRIIPKANWAGWKPGFRWKRLLRNRGWRQSLWFAKPCPTSFQEKS